MPISTSAFPNPSSEYLIINFRTLSGEPITLSLFSSLGTLIYENVISPSSGKIQIDTKARKNGVCFYRILLFENRKNGSGTGKFVVLH
jgi:hypothetical protein